jgi:transcriptional antiterminator NusG
MFASDEQPLETPEEESMEAEEAPGTSEEVHAQGDEAADSQEPAAEGSMGESEEMEEPAAETAEEVAPEAAAPAAEVEMAEASEMAAEDSDEEPSEMEETAPAEEPAVEVEMAETPEMAAEDPDEEPSETEEPAVEPSQEMDVESAARAAMERFTAGASDEDEDPVQLPDFVEAAIEEASTPPPAMEPVVEEEPVEEEPEPEPISPDSEMYDEEEDGRGWYVVHCYSGMENKVRHNLEQRIESMNMKDFIFDVVVPTEEEIEVKEGKRRSVERRVFPGYILVNMLMTEESWYVVRNTPGVTSFVGMGNEPIPLRKDEVSQIIKRMEADAPRIKVSFRQGERVRIVDGPFNDFRGTVDEIDMEKAKVRVMVNFFGRETPVELDFLQVEKA